MPPPVRPMPACRPSSSPAARRPGARERAQRPVQPHRGHDADEVGRPPTDRRAEPPPAPRWRSSPQPGWRSGARSRRRRARGWVDTAAPTNAIIATRTARPRPLSPGAVLAIEVAMQAARRSARTAAAPPPRPAPRGRSESMSGNVVGDQLVERARIDGAHGDLAARGEFIGRRVDVASTHGWISGATSTAQVQPGADYTVAHGVALGMLTNSLDAAVAQRRATATKYASSDPVITIRACASATASARPSGIDLELHRGEILRAERSRQDGHRRDPRGNRHADDGDVILVVLGDDPWKAHASWRARIGAAWAGVRARAGADRARVPGALRRLLPGAAFGRRNRWALSIWASRPTSAGATALSGWPALLAGRRAGAYIWRSQPIFLDQPTTGFLSRRPGEPPGRLQQIDLPCATWARRSFSPPTTPGGGRAPGRPDRGHLRRGDRGRGHSQTPRRTPAGRGADHLHAAGAARRGPAAHRARRSPYAQSGAWPGAGHAATASPPTCTSCRAGRCSAASSSDELEVARPTLEDVDPKLQNHHQGQGADDVFPDQLWTTRSRAGARPRARNPAPAGATLPPATCPLGCPPLPRPARPRRPDCRRPLAPDPRAGRSLLCRNAGRISSTCGPRCATRGAVLHLLSPPSSCPVVFTRLGHGTAIVDGVCVKLSRFYVPGILTMALVRGLLRQPGDRGGQRPGERRAQAPSRHPAVAGPADRLAGACPTVVIAAIMGALLLVISRVFYGVGFSVGALLAIAVTALAHRDDRLRLHRLPGLGPDRLPRGPADQQVDDRRRCGSSPAR